MEGGEFAEGFEGGNENQVVQNENPEYFQVIYYSIVDFFVKYGWGTVFCFVLIMVVWSNVKNSVQNAQKKVKSIVQTGNQSENADKVVQRQEAIMRAREKMQEKVREASIVDAAKRKKAEEQRKQENLKKNEAILTGTSIKSNDYNPLAGPTSSSSGGACFRRPNRGTGGG